MFNSLMVGTSNGLGGLKVPLYGFFFFFVVVCEYMLQQLSKRVAIDHNAKTFVREVIDSLVTG